MPKDIHAGTDPEFNTSASVPIPGDAADPAVIESAVQRLLDNDAFVKGIADDVSASLAEHIVNTDLGQLRADNPSPGGIIPPDAIIHWAKALSEANPENGVNSYGGTIEELVTAVFGNISVVENTDGTSIRIPSIRLQVCYGVTEPQEITTSHGSGFRTATHTHAFPQNFSDTPVVVGGVRNVAGNAVSCYTAGTGGGSFLYRLYALESGTGSVAFVAWGEY